jgi:hypothetical protein
MQRVDGLRCDGRVINLGNWSFKWALSRLLRKGLIRRKTRLHFFRSLDALPYFAITDAGRRALEGR